MVRATRRDATRRDASDVGRVRDARVSRETDARPRERTNATGANANDDRLTATPPTTTSRAE